MNIITKKHKKMKNHKKIISGTMVMDEEIKRRKSEGGVAEM